MRVTVPGMTTAVTFASGSVALVHDATDSAIAANRTVPARILRLKRVAVLDQSILQSSRSARNPRFVT